MIEEYKREQNELAKYTMRNYWFKGFKDNSLKCELYLSAKCNQCCKYCYLARYGDKLYPIEVDDETVTKNAKMIIDYFIEQGAPPSFDIFSGEATVRKMFYDVAGYIIDEYSSHGISRSITVPTNFTFLLNDNLTKKMETLIQDSAKKGVRLGLSASIDGKYLDHTNRPMIGKELRDDEFYEKAFAFATKHGFGFHPMIYSEGIERWRENFLWFMYNFKRYNIPPHALYLLEVRNPEWSPAQIREFGKFLEWLVEWTFNNIANRDKEDFVEFIYRYKGFNILHSPFVYTNKGILCSIQHMLCVRVGDLSVFPCHRLSYNHFRICRFTVDNDKIVDAEADNVEIGIAIWSCHADNFPYCDTCPIALICTHGCLGAQYETTGDLFTPIPTVCALELQKVLSLIKAYKKLKVYDELYNKCHKKIRPSLDWVECLLEEGERIWKR